MILKVLQKPTILGEMEIQSSAFSIVAYWNEYKRSRLLLKYLAGLLNTEVIPLKKCAILYDLALTGYRQKRTGIDHPH